jgi:hypothetical protein
LVVGLKQPLNEVLAYLFKISVQRLDFLHFSLDILAQVGAITLEFGASGKIGFLLDSKHIKKGTELANRHRAGHGQNSISRVAVSVAYEELRTAGCAPLIEFTVFYFAISSGGNRSTAECLAPR